MKSRRTKLADFYSYELPVKVNSTNGSAVSIPLSQKDNHFVAYLGLSLVNIDR